LNQTLINETINKSLSFNATVNKTIPLEEWALSQKPQVSYYTPEFVDFCQRECSKFLVNTEMYQLYIIFIAILSLFVAVLIFNFSDFFMGLFKIDEDKLTRIYQSLNLFAILLLLGFMIYELWF